MHYHLKIHMLCVCVLAQSLLAELASVIQTNLNVMAIAAEKNYGNPLTGMIPDRFCPFGGSLHNKSLSAWVNGIVRIFSSAEEIQAFTQSPTYAGGTH